MCISGFNFIDSIFANEKITNDTIETEYEDKVGSIFG